MVKALNDTRKPQDIVVLKRKIDENRAEKCPFFALIFILEYQEKYTQITLLYMGLSDEYLSYVLQCFTKEQEKKLSDVMDLMRLREL